MTPAISTDSAVRELHEIRERLKEEIIPFLEPRGGLTMACAPAGARSPEQVAELSGSWVSCSRDSPAARMVLTAMRFDPASRCVAVIRNSRDILDICESMLLEVCSFDRAREPPGISTIDWGVAFCCEEIQGVPDIIYDQGDRDKEPLIRIMGENPTTVSARLNRIISRIIDTTLTEE